MAYLKELGGDDLRNFIEFIPSSVIDEATDNDNFEFFGIIESGESIGMVVCCTRGEDVELKFVYVAPHMRGRGIMNRAIDQLSVLYWGESCRYMIMDFVPDLNPEIMAYCESTGYFLETNDSAFFEIKKSDIRDIEEIKGSADYSVVRLSELDTMTRRSFLKRIRDKGIVFDNPEDTTHPVLLDESVVYVEKGVPKGIIVMEKDGDGALRADLFYVESRRKLAPYNMIWTLKRNLSDEYSDDTIMRFFIRNGHLTKVVEKIFDVEGCREVTARLQLDRFDEYI